MQETRKKLILFDGFHLLLTDISKNRKKHPSIF